jgi:Zn-finger nucleic acid-binding protein
MTKIRRVSIRIEHREVTFSIRQTVTAAGEPTAGSDEARGIRPDVCPQCGGPWLPDFQQELRQTPIGLEQLEAVMLSRRLHFHTQADGRFWVCEQSFQHLKETHP